MTFELIKIKCIKIRVSVDMNRREPFAKLSGTTWQVKL